MSKRKIILFILITCLIAMTITGWQYFKKEKPIPDSIIKSVKFQLYYPSQLPEGYTLKKNSFKAENGIVFYQLEMEDQTITISEQSSLPYHIDLKQTPGFGEVPSTAGEASAGIVNNLPVAILITEKTMINITGPEKVSRELVAKIAQSMTTVQ